MQLSFSERDGLAFRWIIRADGGERMKKLAVFVLILSVCASLFAVNDEVGEDISLYKGTLGIGIVSDSSKSVAFSVTGDLGKLEILGSAGLGFAQNQFSFALDAGVTYEIADVDFGRGGHMPMALGIIIPMTFSSVSNSFLFSFALCPVLELEYQMPSTPLSFNVYAGLDITVSGIGQRGGSAVSGGFYGRATLNYWL